MFEVLDVIICDCIGGYLSSHGVNVIILVVSFSWYLLLLCYNLCYHLVVIIFHSQQMLPFFLSRVGCYHFCYHLMLSFGGYHFSLSADVIIFPIICWVVII
jgi:hypothetical protein